MVLWFYALSTLEAGVIVRRLRAWLNVPSLWCTGVLLAPTGAVTAGNQAMDFCELTGALCCIGSIASAAGCEKGGGQGETAALFIPVPLLMTTKGRILLCGGLRHGAARAGGQTVRAAAAPRRKQTVQARAQSRQRHCLNRGKEGNSGSLGNKKWKELNCSRIFQQ